VFTLIWLMGTFLRQDVAEYPLCCDVLVLRCEQSDRRLCPAKQSGDGKLLLTAWQHSQNSTEIAGEGRPGALIIK